jgi:hypothetical protein
MSKISKIIDQTAEIGDILAKDFKTCKDLKVANAATASYRTAIQASKAQLQYFKSKKKGEIPIDIPFYE